MDRLEDATYWWSLGFRCKRAAFNRQHRHRRPSPFPLRSILQPCDHFTRLSSRYTHTRTQRHTPASTHPAQRQEELVARTTRLFYIISMPLLIVIRLVHDFSHIYSFHVVYCIYSVVTVFRFICLPFASAQVQMARRQSMEAE